MFLRRTTLIAAAVFLMNASVHAYDTQGKFGMGISLMGTPVLLFSTMKIGVTNTLGFEPSVGFHRFSISQSYEYDGEKETHKESYNLLMLSAMADIKAIQRERSNFVFRVGASYWRASRVEKNDSNDQPYYSSDPYYNDYYYGDSDNAVWDLSFKAGFGVEHFFTDNFSVYAGAISLFSIFGTNEEDIPNYSSFTSLTSVGSQVAELAFVWYL